MEHLNTHFTLLCQVKEYQRLMESCEKLHDHVVKTGQFPENCFTLGKWKEPPGEIARNEFETWCEIEFPGLYKPIWNGVTYENEIHRCLFKGWYPGYQKGWHDAVHTPRGIEQAKKILEKRIEDFKNGR